MCVCDIRLKERRKIKKGKKKTGRREKRGISANYSVEQVRVKQQNKTEQCMIIVLFRFVLLCIIHLLIIFVK